MTAADAVAILALMTMSGGVRRRLSEDPELLDAIALFAALSPDWMRVRSQEDLSNRMPEEVLQALSTFTRVAKILDDVIRPRPKHWVEHLKVQQSQGLAVPFEDYVRELRSAAKLRNDRPPSAVLALRSRDKLCNYRDQSARYLLDLAGLEPEAFGSQEGDAEFADVSANELDMFDYFDLCDNRCSAVAVKKPGSPFTKVKFLRCSWCMVARYCSKECQTKDWAKHKVACVAEKDGPAHKLPKDFGTPCSRPPPCKPGAWL
ncbi:hypothetical protein DFJ74DRAFT_709209 [Hyaloraphidium curvatum]|nr:hypothetical protein DFJ74DRAFT_709209 [Hyaloraphidium curvatum]